MQIPTPYNIEAEQQILGALLVRDEIYHDIAAEVGGEDFYDRTHAALFRTINLLVDTGKRVNAAIVLDFLQADDKGVRVNADYIDVLMDAVIDLGDTIHYAKQVRDLARRRRWIDAAVDGITRIGRLDPLMSAQLVIDEADVQILNSSKVDVSAVRTIGEWAQLATSRAIEALDRPSAATNGIKWGLTAVDDVAGPILPGKLGVIGGRPGSGKSALAGQAAEYFGRQAPGYIQSLEMDGEEWAIRSMSQHLDIPAWRIEHARINIADAERLDATARELRKLPVWIDKSPRMDIEKIRARAIRYKHKFGIRWMIVDHIHIIEPSFKRQERSDITAKAAEELKKIAKELGIAVIALAQMNKEVRSRDDGRPRSGDLMYYSSIEPHADWIIFTHRPEIAHAERKPDMTNPDSLDVKKWQDKMALLEGKAEIINGKRRGGKAYQTKECQFIGETMRFRDLGTKELNFSAAEEMARW